MINLKDYKVNGKDLSGNKYVEVTDIPAVVGKSKGELVKQFFYSTLSDIVKIYGCGTDYLVELICEIPSSELFTYDIKGMVLLQENAIYTEKYVPAENRFVEKFFNVYLDGSPFFSTVLMQHGIMKKIMDCLYPGLVEDFTSQEPLTEEETELVRMFTEHSDCRLSLMKVPFNTEMTFGELLNYANNPSLINEPKTKTDFILYTHSVYLSLGKRVFHNGYEYVDSISLNPTWLRDMTFEEYLSAPLQQFIYDNGNDRPPRILSEQPIRGSEIEKMYAEKLEKLSKYFGRYKK